MGVKLRKHVEKSTAAISEGDVLDEVSTKHLAKQAGLENLSKDQIKELKNFRDAVKKAHTGEHNADVRNLFRQVKDHDGEIPNISSKDNKVIYSFKNGDTSEISSNLKHDQINQTFNDHSIKVDRGGVYNTGDGNTIQTHSVGDNSLSQNIQKINKNGESEVANSGGSGSHSSSGGHSSGGGHKSGGSGAGDSGAGDADAGDTGVDDVAAEPASGGNDPLAFFTDPKTLIAVGVIAGVAGIIAGIYALGKTIKARFRKTAKVLYTLQKDFGGSKNGLDMDHAMKGVGAKITDGLIKLFGFGNGEKGKGAIGILPFVQGYRDEIKADYQAATKTFESVVTAGSADDFNKDSGEIPSNKSESSGVVYHSFYEAFKAGKLNESADANNMTEEQLNESVLATVGLAFTAGRLAYKAGQYIYMKMSNGKPQEAIPVQVTKQSTREVCFSIMNMFFAKYFNMEQLSKKLGLDVSSLGDIDASNVDKFQKVAEQLKMEQSNNAQVSKMFNRVNKRYNSMVDRYLTIVKNLVKNFEVYSKKMKTKDGKEMSEKDSNLLVSGSQKLYAELDRQEDLYRNNFFRVANAIITSPEYIAYIDFIVSQVIPVFKTGLASDADHVLDVMPKVNEYYVIRQTNAEQTGVGVTEEPKNQAGNIALCRILGMDTSNSKNPIVKFARVALIKNTYLDLNNDGAFDLSFVSEDDLDRSAFAKTRGDNADKSHNGDKVELEYNKWLALDPYIAINVPGDDRDAEDLGKTKLYTREVSIDDNHKLIEYIFGISTKVSEEDKKEFKEDTNISEAGPQPHATIIGGGNNNDNNSSNDSSDSSEIEIEIDNVQQDIIKLACCNIISGTQLTDDTKTNQFSGAFIFLNTKCTAKELDEKLKSLGFSALDGKVKEKEFIENKISENKGYTHISNYKVDNVSKIEDTLKQLETRKTTSEKLFAGAKNMAMQLAEQVKSFDIKLINHPFKFSGATGNIGFITYAKETSSDPYYTKFDTQVQMKNKSNLILHFYPALLKQDGKLVTLEEYNNAASIDPNKPEIKNIPGSVAGIVISYDNHGHGNVTTPIYYPALPDEKSISNALNSLVNDLITHQIIEPTRGNDLGQTNEQPTEQPKEESVAQPISTTSVNDSVQYSTPNNVEEIVNLNIIKVNRNIKSSIDTNGLYILSETCWGDGTVSNPNDSLEKSFNNIFESCKIYSDIASYAKNHKNISLVPFNESCEIKVQAPYYRYTMLTKGCPLYEHLSYFKFDTSEEKKVIEVYNLGTKSFIK